ncbi:MAG: GNAT family N-acetyltransferase [Phycisphaerales bacterium]|nr:GNAT family N-acetyltransferase [Phycisphaerales bacterium]
MSTYSGPLRGDGDVDAIVPILAAAFGSDDAGIRNWLEVAGTENFRTIDEGNGVAACLGLADIGQYFGGCEVSMRGVYGVATAPEHRGRGLALHLMDDALRDAHAAGIAISTLYPATHYLYRRSGYERAGETYAIDLHPASLDIRERPLSMRRITPDDMGALQALFAREARHIDGQLARRSYIWPRIEQPRGERAWGYAATRDGVIEGYVYYTTTSDPDFILKLCVHDIVAATHDAAATLLRFLADHRSTCRTLVLPVSPADPLLLLPGEFNHRMRVLEYWMTRIVSVPRALEARGYPTGLSLRFDLEISEDRVIPDNLGVWTVAIEDGRATVTRARGNSGVPCARMDIRTLAPVYTGFLSAARLHTAGRISADDVAITALDAAIGQRRPWMSNRF